MIQKAIFTVIFFVFALSSSMSQISFYVTSVEEGLKIAKREGKNLFVDTYAEWCIPCKKMQRVFANRELSNYFNNNYINVKVDMDGKYGKETYKKYDVIFLPTMMILDPEGNVKYKTDQIMSAQRLLEIGQQANIAGVYLGNEASQINSNPFNNSRRAATTGNVKTSNPPSTAKTTPEPKRKKVVQSKVKVSEPIAEDNEKILYVLGEGDDVPPEILYQEAYFRMELMDGSHTQAAMDYLNSQSDWGTDKNMRFIFHFVESTDSPLFEYLVQNKLAFEILLGAESVNNSIFILVNQRIYQGYPRPSLDEAKELYAHCQTDYQIPSYQYYLSRLLQENNISEYLSNADEYLAQINKNDEHIMHKSAALYLQQKAYKESQTKKYIALAKKAVNLNEDEPYYRLTLSKLYLLKGDVKKAKNQLDEARNIIDEKNGDLYGEIEQLLKGLGEG